MPAENVLATVLKICLFLGPYSSLTSRPYVRVGMDLYRWYAGFSPASKVSMMLSQSKKLIWWLPGQLTCSAALEWSYFSAMFQWCLITIASTANCNLHYISLHYCSNHRLNWLELAEAFHQVVREDLQTSLLLVRIQLQLPFYRPPFSSQLQTVRMLEWFLLFTTVECSSQSQMQQSKFQGQMHPLQLLWVARFFQLL